VKVEPRAVTVDAWDQNAMENLAPMENCGRDETATKMFVAQ